MMLPRIRQFFTAPIFESEEKTRTARILNIFGWFVVGIVSLLFGYRLITDNWVNISSKLILPFILIATLFSLTLLRRGYVRSAAGISVTFIWSAIAWQAYQAEGLRSASIIAHLAIILFSSLLLGWRSGLVYGVLSIALIWLLAFQEQTGIRFFVDTPPFDFARSLTIIFIATGVLIYLLIHNLNRSLAEARLELKERLRADEKLQIQAQYLTALHETALGLINRLELNPLLESILDRVSELMDTPHVGIDLLTPDETVFKQELGKGMFLDFNGDVTGKGVGLVGKVWESGRTILTEDYSKYPNRRREAEEAGFGAVLGTPLKSGNKVVGSLLVTHTDKHKKFTQEQVILLERLAALASVAIDNARLYEEAHKEIAERKQVEQDLRSSEGRFRKVFNNDNIAISIVTLEEGTFLEANNAFWQLTGLSPQQALGHSSLEFDLWNRPEDRARFVQELLEKGSLQNVEVEFPGKASLFKNIHCIL
jgi:GAF domain-containing protein